MPTIKSSVLQKLFCNDEKFKIWTGAMVYCEIIDEEGNLQNISSKRKAALIAWVETLYEKQKGNLKIDVSRAEILRRLTPWFGNDTPARINRDSRNFPEFKSLIERYVNIESEKYSIP